MAVSVVMPALEMAQETGKLVSWKKKEGEPVKKGEMLLEVETDKAVVEIEAGADGVLGGVTAKVGDVVPVGQTIAWLLKAGEAVPASAGAAAPARAAARWTRLRPPRRRRRAPAHLRAGVRRGRARFRPRRAGWRASTAWTSRRLRGSGRGRRDPRRRHPEGGRACRRRTPTPPAPAGLGPAADGCAPSTPQAPRVPSTDDGVGDLDRPDHGRAHDAELDARCRTSSSRATWTPPASTRSRAPHPGDRAVARREGDAHRPPRRRRGARRCASSRA